MRVGIIAANNIRLSPYIFFYTDILSRANMDFELVFPQRNGLEDTVPFETCELPWDKEKPNLLNYIVYKSNVIHRIEQEKYDFLIILTTVMAVFLGEWLKKHYKNKYLVDIRDYTYENNPVYYLIEKRVIENSKINVISSARFREFLPEGNYHICHNLNRNMCAVNTWKKQTDCIVIGYVGAIAYKDQCKWMMNLVKNDSRFRFDFYGSGISEMELREYAKQLQCERICFFGGYRPDEKKLIIDKVDILFNAYGNDNLTVKGALSNKLYDALYYKKLLLTNTNTAMTDIGGILAYPMEGNEQNLDGLYQWYQEKKEEEIVQYAQTLLAEILNEQDQTITEILHAIIQ